ncbi:unnamed protein product [Didymodactylos carnosus]|uniref:Uncharacterized protein n=2 Tax=Didymodactylos carnosus TaxID=1234261 RepID=A0A8S2NIA9_9BILA|nr:unnamed protein product [Didymodactylos carnosus]CAF4002867.1 unnamed protein product [Didymodactylos carnosus]
MVAAFFDLEYSTNPITDLNVTQLTSLPSSPISSQSISPTSTLANIYIPTGIPIITTAQQNIPTLILSIPQPHFADNSSPSQQVESPVNATSTSPAIVTSVTSLPDKPLFASSTSIPTTTIFTATTTTAAITATNSSQTLQPWPTSNTPITTQPTISQAFTTVYHTSSQALIPTKSSNDPNHELLPPRTRLSLSNSLCIQPDDHSYSNKDQPISTTINTSTIPLTSENDIDIGSVNVKNCQTDYINPSEYRPFEWLHRVPHLHDPIPYYQMSIIEKSIINPSTEKPSSNTSTQTDLTTTITNPIKKPPLPNDVILKREINRQIRFRNHNAILETHTTRSSLPSSLTHFPTPTIGADNIDFIKKWNDICLSSGKQLLQLTIKYVTENIDNIEQKIENLTHLIEENDDPKIIEKLPQLYAEEEKKLATFIANSWSKQIRHIITPTTVYRRQSIPHTPDQQTQQHTTLSSLPSLDTDLQSSSVPSFTLVNTTEQYPHRSTRSKFQPYSNHSTRSSRSPTIRQLYPNKYTNTDSTFYNHSQQQRTEPQITNDLSSFSNYHFKIPLMDMEFTPQFYNSISGRPQSQHPEYLSSSEPSPSPYSIDKNLNSNTTNYSRNNYSVNNYSRRSTRRYNNNPHRNSPSPIPSSSYYSNERTVSFLDTSRQEEQYNNNTINNNNNNNNNNNYYNPKRTITYHNRNFQQQQPPVTIIDNYIEQTHRPSSNDPQHQYNTRSSTRPPQPATTAPLPIHQSKNPSEHYPRTKFRH